MSRSHVRIENPELTPVRRKGLEILSAVVFVLVAGGVIAYMFSRPPFDTEHDAAPGKILESRIDVFEIVDGGRGGVVRYQIKTHVQYWLKGQLQDRWMAASEPESNRDYLVLEIREHPHACQVYWTPAHPENPKCRFE